MEDTFGGSMQVATRSEPEGKRGPEIGEVGGRLEQMLVEAHEVFKQVEGRVSPVLRPPTPENPVGMRAVTAAYESGLAQMLDERCEQVAALIRNMRDVLNRVEL